MDDTSKIVLTAVGINFENEEQIILRETLLNDAIYKSLKNSVVELKKIFSSSALTSLHKEATSNQKWPLLNLVRQILNVYGYHMKPIRKCDGYTPDGVKKFKRFFQIVKKIKK